ncbi:MAG: flagellar hook-associated protein FlgL [Candidatus Neomarinimicrobiota bacterium]
MRVTQSMIARNIIQSMNQSRENLNTLQVAMSTGKEIQRPSNDPVDFTRNSRFRTAISNNEQYLRTINDSEGWLTTTTDTLDQFYQQLEAAKELATQGADESNSAESRAAMAIKVNGIIDEMVSLVNTTYMDKFLFGGTATQDDLPFDRIGDTISYNGNSGNITRRITENHSVAININGQQLLDSTAFTAAADLKTALETNDAAAVRDSITALRSAADNTLILLTSVGSISNQIEFARQRLETANLNLTSILSQNEDVDMAEAITLYNAEEISYQAALQSASNVMELNLMQFLK